MKTKNHINPRRGLPSSQDVTLSLMMTNYLSSSCILCCTILILHPVYIVTVVLELHFSIDLNFFRHNLVKLFICYWSTSLTKISKFWVLSGADWRGIRNWRPLACSTANCSSTTSLTLLYVYHVKYNIVLSLFSIYIHLCVYILISHT